MTVTARLWSVTSGSVGHVPILASGVPVPIGAALGAEGPGSMPRQGTHEMKLIESMDSALTGATHRVLIPGSNVQTEVIRR